MRYIECGVNNEFVSGAGQVIGAAGSHHAIAIRMTFSDAWAMLTKRVLWIDAKGTTRTETLLTSDLAETESVYVVPIPAAPLQYEGKVSMTVYGVELNGTSEVLRLVTKAAFFDVMTSYYDPDSAPDGPIDIDPTIADQMQAEIDAALADILDAREAAKDAEAWAVGQIEGADVPETDTRYENNSKYYAQRADESAAEAYSEASAAFGSASSASGSAETATQKAMDAADSAEDSEAWAVGQRGGTDVDSSDETYHNNAKYWAGQAQQAAGGGVSSFNGRSGAVVPQSGDYTAAMVGARASDWTPTASDVGADQSGAAAAVQASLNAHASNNTIHISAAERTAWNAKANFPAGGTAGQILTKTATGTKWGDAPLGFAPQVVVTAPTGSTVTLTNGTTTLTATESSGTWTFDIPNYGAWTATATLGTDTASDTVSITEVKQYTMTLAFVNIYGVQWDGTSTTKWTRTDAAADFPDPVPAVNNGNGSSPFDGLQPWAGMQKVNRDGGVMVSIPKFWYKITQSGNGLKIQIADTAVDGFSVSPAHMDRGDGKGERDVVYVGRYHCANSTYKSETGKTPMNSQTRSTFRTQCHNIGSTTWLMGWPMRFTLFLLYLVEFADWNTQAKIGKGCGNNSGVQNMGYTDGMTYHTGTSLSSRDTYGLGTQYRWIEGLWDNVYDWIDECYNSSNGLMLILNPTNSSDSSGGVSVGTPTSGWPSKFTMKNVSGTFPLFIPSEASGSETTYSCDYWGFNASYPCVYAGGDYFQGGDRGLFCWNNGSATYKSANIGGRLQELP